MIPIRSVYAVEVSGVCNLTKQCTQCPMHTIKRKRGVMSDETVARALSWVEKLAKPDALALHNFGEPLLHPKFDSIALAFSKLVPVTMSTNASFLDAAWADRLARIPWTWISISPWDPKAALNGDRLLRERGIRTEYPPGMTHDWAGQASGPIEVGLHKCEFLSEGRAVIRWDGAVASCCISDREEDAVGSILDEPESVSLRGYSLCASCRFAV